MRNIPRSAGVHVYRDSNDVLFADRHFVAIHTGPTPATGLLKLPRATPVFDVFNAKQIGRNLDAVQLNVSPNSTVLYYLGPWKEDIAIRD